MTGAMMMASGITAAGGAVANFGPKVLAVNTGTLNSLTTAPNITVNFGNESGSNRLLLLCICAEGTASNLYTTCDYDTVTGTRVSLGTGADGGQGIRVQMFYWVDSQLPGSSGNKTLAGTLNVSMQAHMATMILFEDVDQDTPVALRTVQVSTGVTSAAPPVTLGPDTYNRSLEHYAMAIMAALADNSGTYASGDIIQSGGSTIAWQSELNVRNAPGGAGRAGVHEDMSNSSEAYTVSYSNGASSSIDSYAQILVPIIPVKGTAALTTTITSGSATVKTTTSVTDHGTITNNIQAYGFDVGSDPWLYGPGYGSVATGTYTDGTSTSRTIDACTWLDHPFGGVSQRLAFVLDTTSVPDNDNTFHSIAIDGVHFARADAAYTSSIDGGSMWEWDTVSTNPFIGANPDDFIVYIGQ